MKPKKKIAHVILVLLACVAAVVLIAHYGVTLPLTPFSSIKIDGPTAADSDGKITAIADSGSHRVLILDENHSLTGIIDCTAIDSPLESITDICVANDCVYLAGTRTRPDSSSIEKERVVPYAIGGWHSFIAYELKGSNTSVPNIKTLCESPTGVITIVKPPAQENSSETQYLKMVLIDETGAHEQDTTIPASDIYLHDVAITPDGQHYSTLSVRGVLNDNDSNDDTVFPDRTITAIDHDDASKTFACDDASGALCVLSDDGKVEEIVEGSGYENVHVNGETITLSDRGNDSVKICDLHGTVKHTITEATPGLELTLRTIGVWLSAAYLAVLAIVVLVRRLHRQLASGNVQSLGPLFAALSVLVVMGLAIMSMSFSSYESATKARSNEINTFADHFNTRATLMSESMEKCATRSLFRAKNNNTDDTEDAFNNILLEVDSLVESASANGIGLYFRIYGKDDKGIFYLVGNLDNHVFGSSAAAVDNLEELNAAFGSADQSTNDLHTGLKQGDITKYRLVSIPTTDGTSVAGVIEIGCKTRSFETSIFANIAHHVLELLVMSMVVYLTYTELRACVRCLVSYDDLRKRHHDDALATLTRPFTLGITLLTSIDGVMTVLIARDLLESSGMGSSNALIALPAVMLGIGMIIGQGLYGFTGARVSLRRLIATGAVCMLVFALGTAAVVRFGTFWMYCGAKLAMSVPFGLLYSLGYSLPRVAKSDETRALAAGGVKRTDTSAAVLGTVVGGYAAQLLGNAWVYIIVAVACLPVLAMALGKLPKGDRPLEHREEQQEAVKDVRHLFRQPSSIALALLIIFPTTVALGYTSFIFPLFVADFGLSKADVNSIYALGQVIVFACIGIIERIEGRYGKWRASTVAMALEGVTFLLFALNTTFAWSLVVVAIIGVLCKLSDGWKAMWLHAANETGVQAGVATGAMFAVRSLALTIRPFLLGALLGATNVLTVIILGALCLGCGTVFYFTTRRSCLPNT